MPAVNAAAAGRIALASDEVNPTVSVTEPTRFQLASTALTVTLNGASDVSAVGVPVLPVEVPGDAVSPGTNSWSFANAPAFTVTLAVVYPVNPVALAVMVRVPPVLKVKLDKVKLVQPRALIAGDVDGDGASDLIVTQPDGDPLLLQIGNEIFVKRVQFRS